MVLVSFSLLLFLLASPPLTLTSLPSIDALGGLVPLLPYFLVETALEGLYYSIAITTVVLLAFGGFKTYYTGAQVGVQGYLYGCISTLMVGGSAAAASFGIVKALEGTGL